MIRAISSLLSALTLALAMSPLALRRDARGEPSAAALTRRLATLSGARGAALRPDPALAQVARRHAAELLETPDRASRGRVSALLAAEGLVDPDPLPFSGLGRDPAALERALEAFIGREAGARGLTHLGVGAASREGRHALVALLVRRPVALAPLPVRVSGHAFTLRGRGPPALGLDAWRFGPCLDPLTCQAQVEALEVRRVGGDLAVHVDLEDEGVHRVALLARTERGPETVALWTVGARAEVPAPRNAPALADLDALTEAVRRVRELHDVGPATRDRALDAAARGHARAICEAGVAMHVLADGLEPGARARRAGFDGAVAENVAVAATLGEAHRDLMTSPAHRRNVIDPFVSSLGLGMAHRGEAEGSGPAVCLVELLGRPRRQPPR